MKQFAFLSPAVAALLFCGAAFAAPTADACVDLQANVNAVMQARLRASVPKESPSTFNQNSSDIKGIMSMDVASGFSKLMSMDFSGLADKLLQKGVDQAQRAGNSYFNNRVNGVLNSYGVANVDASGIANGDMSTAIAAGSAFAQTQARAGIANAANGAVGAVLSSTGINAANLAAQAVQSANAAQKVAVDAAAATARSVYSRQPVPGPN